MEPQKMKVTPKDFFLQIAVTLCLYTSVVSVLALVFEIINQAYPDALNYYYSDPYSGGIRFAIASLLIIFPIFLVLAHFIRKDYEAIPEKRDLWTRKWITYLNLFISGITIATSLILVLYDFLGGELQLRFGLKALSTVVVTALVFGYFITDIRKGIAFSKKARSIYLGIAVLLVIGSIVSGFFIMGSPFTQRLRKLDNQRVSDLQNIQWQVVNYWQAHGALPSNLATLNDSISGFVAPRDPAGQAYEYKTKGTLSFELCGMFETESVSRASNNPPSTYRGVGDMTADNWAFKQGRFCFERTIDPLLYPVRKP